MSYFELHDDPRQPDDYDVPTRHCYQCEEKDDQICQASILLEKLVKQLYIPGKFDVINFENNFEDLCYSLNVSLGEGDLQIEQKKYFSTLPIEKTYQLAKAQ